MSGTDERLDVHEKRLDILRDKLTEAVKGMTRIVQREGEQSDFVTAKLIELANAIGALNARLTLLEAKTFGEPHVLPVSGYGRDESERAS